MFIEARLLDELAYGLSGGPTWSTLRTGLKSGITRRNVMRSRPLHKFDGSFDGRDEKVLAVLLAAFNATRGAAFGFRFKNWMDYQLQAEAFAVGTGASQIVQLTKAYTFGAQTVLVPIRKPNEGLVIKEGGNVLAATVDTTTGIISFTAPPGSVITASGTFDLPVSFDNDEFGGAIDSLKVYTIDIQLTEDMSA
ncbi:MAG: DUF2460 domain-containing protein [Pseudomonadaceae bacterium]|nr:DUF2460 domain-containing protein [Pseudomonadaceae bacterium]